MSYFMATLIVALLKLKMTKAFNFSIVTMEKLKANAWSTTNQISTIVDGEVYIYTLVIFKSKDIVAFPCCMNYN